MTRFSHENWPLLSPLLDEALELPPSAREAWLAQHRISHPTLAAELEALLNGEEELERDGFLDRAEAPALPPVPSLAGQRLGAYVVERKIGQGGMGSVWLARRSDGLFEGAVAIKFLSLAVAGPAGEARFRREGSVLARLTHPNIARLLDAGVTPEGQPYLVLEHVDGLPLDAWCDQRHLPVEARLTLFLQVIAAVAHAHANLIVHRDLKPANILVTPDGTVKLLDFGIAKLLEQSSEEGRSVLTGSHEAVLTFEYAAPEQVQGEPISTATDVYALGVILYQLLTGRHPTSPNAITPADHVRAILEVEPALLSRAVGPSGTITDEEATRLAAARDSTPDRLRRWYSGDLDNIISKSLRKSSAERYPTVTALGDDLARYLGHEPVLARPDTWTYRAAKFIRRNRGSVSSAVLVATLLVAAAILTTIQAREARRQRDLAVMQLERGHAMTMVQQILASDSRGADGKPLSSAERIVLATGALQRQYSQKPWLVAEVIADLSGTFFENGDRVTQRSILLDAQTMARTAKADAQLALASCHRVSSFAFDQLFDSARADLVEAKAAMGRASDLPTEVASLCLDAEGMLLSAEGHPDSAVPVLAHAIERINADSGAAGLDVTFHLQLLNDYAQALRSAGRPRDASRYQLEVARRLDEAGYTETDVLPHAIGYLVATLNELGEFASEDSMLGYFIARQEKTHGIGRPNSTLAFLHGVEQLHVGQLDSAEIWLARSMHDSTQSAEWAPNWAPPALTELKLTEHRTDSVAVMLPNLIPGGALEYRNAHYAAWLRYLKGDKTGALIALEDTLRVLSAKGGRLSVRMVPPLLAAAEWRLAAGNAAAADSLALRGRDIAAVDSLALTRSGLVGLSELWRARARRALGDDHGAREAADRAVVALSNGMGAGLPYTRQAVALRDSLSH